MSSMQQSDSAVGANGNHSGTPFLSSYLSRRSDSSANVLATAGIVDESELAAPDVQLLASELQLVAEPLENDDDQDVESTKRLSVERQLEMLRGRLARRNQIIEVIRRAYYQDVILVKEELRHRSLSHNPQQSAGSFDPSPTDDRLAGVPSVDLRDTLPLFAPAETVLMVHPCETCGGHLELIHGEVQRISMAKKVGLLANTSASIL